MPCLGIVAGGRGRRVDGDHPRLGGGVGWIREQGASGGDPGRPVRNAGPLFREQSSAEGGEGRLVDRTLGLKALDLRGDEWVGDGPLHRAHARAGQLSDLLLRQALGDQVGDCAVSRRHLMTFYPLRRGCWRVVAAFWRDRFRLTTPLLRQLGLTAGALQRVAWSTPRWKRCATR